jgi:hypothetical protein
MEIRHRGWNTDLTRSEIEYATGFFLKKLMPHQLVSKLTVNMSITDLGNYKGECCQESVEIGTNPREFWVGLSKKLKRRGTLRVIAHECVHIKQGATGQMWDYSGADAGWTRWNKRDVRDKDWAYKQRPWEKEAFRREKVLYNAYMRHLKKEQLTFED